MAGVGQEGQGVRVERAKKLGDEERRSDQESGLQTATGTASDFMMVIVGASVLGHITDIIIVESGCYNTRFSRDPSREVFT
jgi:hypothetical protein